MKNTILDPSCDTELVSRIRRKTTTETDRANYRTTVTPKVDAGINAIPYEQQVIIKVKQILLSRFGNDADNIDAKVKG
jgi:hypothetical protein